MFRVEFNTSGFYSGAGIWETVDEIAKIKAENAQEAIEYAIDWFIENSDGDEGCRVYAWKASKITVDEYGNKDYNNWEFKEE